MPCEERVIATTVEEALANLACLQGAGRILGGGTSLLPQLQMGDSSVECLIDVTHIPGLADIRAFDSFVMIGAATTFAQLAASDIISLQAPALAQAASALGPPEVRALATLGGNVANARPSANGALALLALQAEVEIANLTGSQWVPVAQLFAARSNSHVDPSSEIITAFRFPSRAPHESSAFERLPGEQGVPGWHPPFQVAAGVLLDASAEHFREVRLALGAVASKPCRVGQTERSLCGGRADNAAIVEAAELALREVEQPPSWQPSRDELVAALQRALIAAVARARQP